MNHSDSVEQAIQQMQENLRQLLSQHKNESWLQKGSLKIAEILSGDKDVHLFGKELILFLTEYAGCSSGTVYKADNQNKLNLVFSLGIKDNIQTEQIGDQSYFAQAISRKSYTLIEDISETYFNLPSSLLNPGNGSLIILPLFFNDHLTGIIELAKIGKFTENELVFMVDNSKAISIYLNTLIAKENLENLLETLDSKEQELQNRIGAINKATLMIEYNPEGFIVDVNDLFLKLSGYKKDELIGQHHRILSLNPDQNREENKLFWEELRKGKSISGEFQRKTKDDQLMWLQASYTPVSDIHGNIYNVIKIGYDISQLKNQQIKIEEISLRLQQQIDVLNQTAIVSETDAEGNITYVNDLFCAISEYSREELIGKNHRLLKSGKQPDGLFTGMWAAIKKGLTWQGEILNISKNGNYYWVDSTITPFKNKEGVIEKFVAIRFDITRQKESEALKRQTEALLLTQRELEESNAELEAQAQKLQASEEELRVQQEELMQSNKELDEKRSLLEEKNHLFNLKNIELESASNDLRKKTEELELSSKYKSEFLANMSHELRTPLNSIILLSKLMTDNLEGNLSGDQLEYVGVINKAGNNLLELINDILDLSKIESGKMDISPEKISLAVFKKETEGLFNQICIEKEISFSVVISENCPSFIFTDRMRLDQVIKNLLSNAIKFSAKGIVSLLISSEENKFISFSVSDTGIGIPKDKQALIFEAFQQADGSTKRKYGGTGLGLSISREIAHLLGGSITLESEPGKGSTFTISIPEDYSEEKIVRKKVEENKPAASDALNDVSPVKIQKPQVEVNLDDDRKSISAGDKTILIVEDDEDFAKILLRESRARGFKVLVAMNGNDACILAKKYIPDGMILDINLPQKNGWEVLKEIRDFAETKDIPVHIVSSEDISRRKGLDSGAQSVTAKPLTSEALQNILGSFHDASPPENQGILLLSDLEEQRKALHDYLSENGFEVQSHDAEKNLEGDWNVPPISVIILDIHSRKTRISNLLENLRPQFSGNNVTVIVLASNFLSSLEQKRIENFKTDFNLKTVKRYSDVAEEINLFFSYLSGGRSEKKLKPLVQTSRILENKKILVVDDDDQNLFSIGKLLETQKAVVVKAMNGLEALEKFRSDSGISLILMDVMMPVMDGYEAVREIRKLPAGKDIPIITLTAKSQADEREKSLKNGSSDFITKPLDGDQLISLMKVWLGQSKR